jgi:hypothetical protein
MQRRNWSNIVLVASWVPSATLVAYVLWYMLVYRPSGQEAWGDGATIFYLGALTYPVSFILLGVGIFLAVRWRRGHPGVPTAGPALFLVSLLLLVAPLVALFAAAS